MAYGFNEDRSRAPMYTKDEVDEAIADAFENPIKDFQTALSTVGGDGTLIFSPELEPGDSTNAFADFNATVEPYIWHDKNSNNLGMRLAFKNNTGSTISVSTPIFRIPRMQCRYKDAIAYVNIPVLIVTRNNGALSQVNICKVRVSGNGDEGDNLDLATCWTDIYLSTSMPADSVAFFLGSAPSAVMQGWQNSTLSNSVICQEICEYYLKGPGEFNVGTGDDQETLTGDWTGRLPYGSGGTLVETQGYSNADAQVFASYRNSQIRPQNAARADYVADGVCVSYAKKGEELDLSNAVPGDIIVFRNPLSNLDKYASWATCALYAGGNVLYHITSHYPADAETVGGIEVVDSYGPYPFRGASTYRMSDSQSTGGGIIVGCDRAVVRFI